MGGPVAIPLPREGLPQAYRLNHQGRFCFDRRKAATPMNKFSEKKLEDFLCCYPNMLAPDYENGTVEIIGRQLILPSGRLDILAIRNQWQILVTELKAVALHEKDLTQVLRYTADIKHLLFDLAISYEYEESPITNFLQRHINNLHGIGQYQSNDFPTLVPILIGKSAPKNLLAAADGCSAEIYRYHHSLQKNTINIECLDTIEPFIWKAKPSYPIWADKLSTMLIDRARTESGAIIRATLFAKVNPRRVRVHVNERERNND